MKQTFPLIKRAQEKKHSSRFSSVVVFKKALLISDSDCVSAGLCFWYAGCTVRFCGNLKCLLRLLSARILLIFQNCNLEHRELCLNG